MIERLRQHIPHQLAFLLSALLLSYLLGTLLDSQPRLRLTPVFFLKGVAWGLVLSILLLSLQGIALYLQKDYQELLAARAAALRAMTPYRFIGAILTAAVTEEVLLRGVCFKAFTEQIGWLAYPSHALLVFGLYFSGRKQWAWAVSAAALASCYALLFTQYRSIGIVIVAHASCDLFVQLLLRSKKGITLLNGPPLFSLAPWNKRRIPPRYKELT